MLKYDYNYPEFYVGQSWEERDYIIYRDDKWVVCVQGKICLKYDGQVLRSAYDLIRAGLDSDDKLTEAFQSDKIEPEDTPWFEVYTVEEFEAGDCGVVCYEMVDVESMINSTTVRG